MANFINKKERVLDVKLTPYGKQMFSKGKLKPSYYCFYDHDILYDGEYGGIEETQNDIVDRINSTQRLALTTDLVVLDKTAQQVLSPPKIVTGKQ